jgi:hypothetical protein
MKKTLAILFLIAYSFTGIAQESVLLRWKNKVGDKFKVTATIKQDMGKAGGMDMKMSMSMKIIDKKEENYICEMQYKRVVMNMLQGGVNMSFDTAKKEEDLSETERAFNKEMKPMLDAVMTATYDDRGNTKIIKVTPDVPAIKELADQYESVAYPKEAVKVGSSWVTEKENKGIKIQMTQTVKKITKEKVFVAITGKAIGMENMKISGNLEIERKTGIPLKFGTNIVMDVMGQKMDVSVTLETKKVN